MGLADISPRKFADGKFHSIGDPVYDARLTKRIQRVARTLTSTGATLRWATFPHVDIPFSSGGTGDPPFVENDPKRIDSSTRSSRGAGRRPRRVHGRPRGLRARRPGGELDPEFRGDGAHFTASGTAEVAKWLGPQLHP